MTTRSYPAIARFAVAGLFGVAACSTLGDNLPTSIESPTSARFAVGITTNSTPELGKLKICKSGESNVAGSFTFVRQQFGDGTLLGYIFAALTSLELPAGVCVVVAEDNGGNLVGSRVRVTELGGDLVSVSGQRVDQEVGGTQEFISPLTFANGDEVVVNIFHGATITFVNTHVVVPPPVCDFITFGRLVTEVNGQKVVISGNAGGNKPGGGILGEFHIEANGVDNHVADIDSYVPAGALLNLTNARIVKGTAKNGVAVELRLWDGGEPGKGTDRVWVKLGNSVLIGGPLGQLIDQGNMQYHNVCRGPGD
jgi:hypothetical protein